MSALDVLGHVILLWSVGACIFCFSLRGLLLASQDREGDR